MTSSSPSSADQPIRGPLAAEQLETLRSGLRLMALRQLGDAELADEVAQETLARTLAAMSTERGREIQSLGAFVHGIARHVIADIRRGRQRSTGSDALAQTPDPASIERDALRAIVSEDEAARVRLALARLAPGDRMILHLSFYEGLTPAEVAERLHQDSVVVRKRKSRALERLRQEFLSAGSGHAAASPATPIQADRTTATAGPEVAT